MPEWTGKTREKVYELLSGGRLDEAFAVIKTFPKFKQADMKPVDAKAMACFDEKLRADENLQALLARSSLDEAESIRRFGLFLLGQLRPLDGKHFIGLAYEIVEPLAKGRASHDPEFDLRWIGPEQKLSFKTGKALTADEIVAWIDLNMGWFAWSEKKRIHSFVEAICTSPSREALAILDFEGKIGTRPYNRSYIETDRVLPPVLRNKYEKALARVEKDGKAKYKTAEAQPAREQLHVLMAGGDLDDLKQFIESMPKMPAAQVKALCENIPERTKDVLREVAKLETIFDWMQDTGALGQIAAEWVDQGEWPGVLDSLMKWMIDVARKTGTWRITQKNQSVLVSNTNPPRFDRHMELMAKHLDSGVVRAIMHSFPKQDERLNSIYYFLQDHLGAKLLKQFGLKAAREKLNAVDYETSGLKTAEIVEFTKYVRRLKVSVERWFAAADPIREVAYYYGSDNEPIAPEQLEKVFKEWQKDHGFYGYWWELPHFMEVPEYAKELILFISGWMAEGDGEHIDNAFRLLMLAPELAETLGYNLTELTAHALWHIKSSEVNRAILRMRALVQRGVCKPADAAGLIEQAFASEEPATWRAAAEAMASLRKMDPSIKLKSTKRIEDLIARDPAKYGKFLSPLIDGGKDGAKK